MVELKSSKFEGSEEHLCFDKNEFMKSNFSVDEFLHKNRHAPSLELLRDNLGLYLKGLRASMIDLINEDYADFVNLSANLVGLDQSIETIQSPLGRFRTEIEGIEALIKENEVEIRAQLEKKRQIRELRRNLQCLKKVNEAITKLEDLLANQLSEKLNPIDLERAALELIQLKFNEKFCLAHLNEEQKQNIQRLDQCVHEKLRQFFNASLKTASSSSTDQLERCLRIYITLDACQLAEKVFRDDIVAPYMSNTISEHSLQNSPQGLPGIYSKILNFISLHMTDLLRLTQYTDKLSGFNFLINSFWADVEMRLETHMTSIFAPGNSDVFYAKYKCTKEFLNKIEALLADEKSVNMFRQHKQLKSFQARWNLPVYFQICFQEIAGQFESTLEPVAHDDIFAAKGAKLLEYELMPFNSAEQALKRCWSDGVYLAEVFPKFYKLNVQIIMRLSRWVNDLLQAVNRNAVSSTKWNKNQLLVATYQDINKFVEKLTNLHKEIYEKLKQAQNKSANMSQTLSNSFADIKEVLCKHLKSIEQALMGMLVTESANENVRQVNDLPRLYRKTNRDIPTRCSVYVEQMLRPLKCFNEEQTSSLGTTAVAQILSKVCSQITVDYYNAVSDVLTSVQKTEESLRRLRNLKSGTGTMSTSLTSSASSAAVNMTDDDKIRLQLRVDVIAWTGELAKLGFMPSDITKLTELNNMVEESVKVKE